MKMFSSLPGVLGSNQEHKCVCVQNSSFRKNSILQKSCTRDGVDVALTTFSPPMFYFYFSSDPKLHDAPVEGKELLSIQPAENLRTQVAALVFFA